MLDELNRRLPDSKTGGKDQPRGSSQQCKVPVKELAGRVKIGALNVLKHSRGKTQLTFWRGAVKMKWHDIYSLHLSSDTYIEAFQYKLLLEVICCVIFYVHIFCKK